MQTITAIGLDIAKSVFQVHCVDAAGQVVIRRQLKRRYGGRTARNAGPVDPAVRTTHLCHRIVECGFLTGT
jgi:transposase